MDNKVPFDVTYGTGQINGTTVQDSVMIAGLLLANHSFGTAQIESVQFSSCVASKQTIILSPFPDALTIVTWYGLTA